MKKVISFFVVMLCLLSLAIPVYGQNQYVFDEAGLLEQGEIATLEKNAKKMAETYQCGIYIVTVEDYYEYGVSMHDAAINIFEENGFGLGETKDGYLLLLSMYDRDYWMLVHGDNANPAFTDYGMEHMEEQFLDDFRYDDFYEGFLDYQKVANDYLKRAKKGKPYDFHTSPQGMLAGGILSLVIGVLTATVVTMTLKSGMKHVHLAKHADAYVDKSESSNLLIKTDLFTYASESRRYSPVEKKSSSSSRSRSSGGGGGYRGSGGKF